MYMQKQVYAGVCRYMQVYAGRGASSERCHLIMTNMSRHVHKRVKIKFSFRRGWVGGHTPSYRVKVSFLCHSNYLLKCRNLLQEIDSAVFIASECSTGISTGNSIVWRSSLLLSRDSAVISLSSGKMTCCRTS